MPPEGILSRTAAAAAIIDPRPVPESAKQHRKTYQAVLKIVALRAQGFETTTIAERLGFTPATVRSYIHRAVAMGWINLHSFDAPDDRVEHVLRHKAVRNIDRALDEVMDDGSMSLRASEMAIEVARGTGLFKTHQVMKSDGGNGLGVALQVNVVMPPDHDQQTSNLRVGSIGGTPTINADVIGEP